MHYKKSNLFYLLIFFIISTIQIPSVDAGFGRDKQKANPQNQQVQRIRTIEKIGIKINDCDLKEHQFSHHTLRWLHPLLYANHLHFRGDAEEAAASGSDVLATAEEKFQRYTDQIPVWNSAEITFEQLSVLAFNTERRTHIRLGYMALLLIMYADICPPENEEILDTPFEIRAAEDVVAFKNALADQVGDDLVTQLRDTRSEKIITQDATGVDSIVLPCMEHSSTFEDDEIIQPAHPAHQTRQQWIDLTEESDLIEDGCTGGWSQVLLEKGPFEALKEKLRDALAGQHNPITCPSCQSELAAQPPAPKRTKTDTEIKSEKLLETSSGVASAVVDSALSSDRFSKRGLGHAKLCTLIKYITEHFEGMPEDSHFKTCNISTTNVVLLFLQALQDVRLESSEKAREWAHNALTRFFKNTKLSSTLASTVYATTGCNMLNYRAAASRPDTSYSAAIPPQPYTPANETVLTSDNLGTLSEELEGVASCWKCFGTQLGIKFDTICMIDTDHRDCLSKLTATLSAFLKWNGKKKPTWAVITNAVANPAGANDPAKAENIARNHGLEKDPDNQGKYRVKQGNSTR